MATLYTDNFQKAFIDKPSQPFSKGEAAGRKRLLMGRITLPAATAEDDVIQIGYIPANSVIVDAKIIISKSLGATGIFELGHGASTAEEDASAIALDTNGLVSAADGGGQAALKRADLDSVILGKRLGSETLIYATCTEVMDGSVADAVAYFMVEYVND